MHPLMEVQMVVLVEQVETSKMLLQQELQELKIEQVLDIKHQDLADQQGQMAGEFYTVMVQFRLVALSLVMLLVEVLRFLQ